jgi:hypothetical protein
MDCRCFLYGLEIAEIFSRKIQNLVPLGLDSLIPNFVAYMEDTVCGYSQMKCVRLSKINMAECGIIDTAQRKFLQKRINTQRSTTVCVTLSYFFFDYSP